MLLHCGQLDHQLAGGLLRRPTAEQALRARELTGPLVAHELAGSLRRLLAEPGRRPSLADSREALLGLAERLERGERLNACGVARVLLLLTDVAGPLYHPSPERSMSELVWWIADGLASCPPHAWGCPVIAKLDPEHVTWTCAFCGAMSVTGGAEEHPEPHLP
ncbi:MAG TPA: hypothetical protein VHX88_18710 [Solirubrobacteraceae bacterium]|nr:hypothetical protein [Solirubrobacteraceae bacterium]